MEERGKRKINDELYFLESGCKAFSHFKCVNNNNNNAKCPSDHGDENLFHLLFRQLISHFSLHLISYMCRSNSSMHFKINTHIFWHLFIVVAWTCAHNWSRGLDWNMHLCLRALFEKKKDLNVFRHLTKLCVQLWFPTNELHVQEATPINDTNERHFHFSY